MPNQLNHTNTAFTKKSFPIILICDGVQSPANIGSLFRICDALGIAKIIFCNASINFSSTRLLRTARNTHKKVEYTISNNCLEEIKILKQSGYSLLALEITDNSIPIEEFDIAKDEKIAMIIGNEQHGVSDEILNQISTSIHINMYGDNSSMNVVQAASIALYNLTSKLKQYFE